MSDLAAWIWTQALALDPWPWGPFWVALACGYTMTLDAPRDKEVGE